MPSTFTMLAVLVFGYTAAAMFSDLRAKRIPNWLTVSSLVGALVFHITTNGVDGLKHSLGGFAAGFGFLLVLWLIGGAGGGDVKLTGALGAWLGAPTTLLVFLISTPLAVLCVVVVNIYRKMKSNSTQTEATVPQTSFLKRGVPYAVPIGISSWSILLLKLISPQ